MTSVNTATLPTEVVRMKPPARHVRYLLKARQERCPQCDTGRRTVSVWVTGRGEGEEVSWCGHCFNAVCEPVQLSEEDEREYAGIRAAVRRRHVSRAWPAARPALADLERRGLL